MQFADFVSIFQSEIYPQFSLFLRSDEIDDQEQNTSYRWPLHHLNNIIQSSCRCVCRSTGVDISCCHQLHFVTLPNALAYGNLHVLSFLSELYCMTHNNSVHTADKTSPTLYYPHRHIVHTALVFSAFTSFMLIKFATKKFFLRPSTPFSGITNSSSTLRTSYFVSGLFIFKPISNALEAESV